MFRHLTRKWRGAPPSSMVIKQERKYGAVESQGPWCRYTPDRSRAILRETFSLGIITKSMVILVFRHIGDETASPLRQVSPRAWAPSTLIALVFRHTGDDMTLLPSRPLLGRGHQVRKDKS